MSIAADNEAVKELATAIGKDMGQLTKLATVDKSSLVDAINETLSRNVGSTGVINTNGGGGLLFWVGTQSEYDAIVTKDTNTLYVVQE